MVDKLGIPIEVGDLILFPAPGELMEAIVTKLIPKKGKYGYDHINCKTVQTGNSKKKRNIDCINVTKIKLGMPEYFL